MNVEASAPPTADQRMVGWTVIAMILVVTVLGGGGASARPEFEAVCHFAGFLLLALLLATGKDRAFDRSAVPWIALCGLAFLLPLIQLMPMPGWLADSLPGRELAEAIRSEAGGNGPGALTLDPDRTIVSALSLIPGIALFAATLRSSEEWRRRFLLAWIAMGLLAVMIGALQVASSGTAAQLYDTPHHDAAIGFFANRNHEAIFVLVVLMLFLAVLAGETDSRARAASLTRAGLVVLLVAGIFISRSRAGLVILVVAVPLLIALLWRGRFSLRLRWPIGALMGVLLAGLVAFALYNPVARSVIARFSSLDDPRWDYWPDVVYTLGQFWPAGTGIGTFQAVFATQERLGTLDERYLNHAHNDYLELAIEGGIAAVVLMVVFAILLVFRFRTILAWQGSARRMALVGAFSIIAILAHSLVDYPLRAITISTMFGFLAALMFRPAAGSAAAEAV